MLDHEMVRLFRELHNEALERDPQDRLAPVISPWDGRLCNAFADYAHRLAMRTAFAYLERKFGSLKDLQVLDIGCGRGRWSQEYGVRGARVTGVDVSEDAISLLRKEMPEHTFLCQDIAALSIPGVRFDIGNSVTVLQHLPPEAQARALERLGQLIRPGGMLVLLENTFDFGAPHVFPHAAREWIGMAKQVGFALLTSREVCFDVPTRVARRLAAPLANLGGAAQAAKAPEFPVNPASAGRRAAKGLLAVLSFPSERFFTTFPMIRGTHGLMLFRRDEEAAR